MNTSLKVIHCARMLTLLRAAVPLVLALATVGNGLSAHPALSTEPAAAQSGVPRFGYKVVKSYPHDGTAYTQGLVYQDGVLYEGTGLNGRSSIRKVRLETSEVLQIRALDQRYFGEGIVIWKDRLIQLTWQSGLGFVYDKTSFAPQQTFSYAGEGWGLTHDGRRLVMSDGSATGTLRFLDPESLKETGRLVVRDGTRPVDKLNELEFVKGELLANVYETNRIARISLTTGRVTGWIDLSGLLDLRDAVGAEVLNGIAYDAAKDRLFVTGKLWPKLFEIQLVPR